MTGEQILNEVRFLIGDASYPRYNEINDAYDEICRITNFTWLRKSDVGRIQFKANQSEYILKMDDMRRLERIWVYGVDADKQYWHEMEEAAPKLFEHVVRKNKDTNSNDELDRPAYYKIEGELLTISPTPDQAYEARIDYIQYVPEISRDIEPVLPVAYHRVLAKLAAGFILEMSEDQLKAQRGQIYIQRARESFESLVRDTAPNRIINPDIPTQSWLS